MLSPTRPHALHTIRQSHEGRLSSLLIATVSTAAMAQSSVPLQSSNYELLPVEIKIAILEHLDKAQLKVARLVSKEWSLLAASLLFDTIYISPRKIGR